MNLARLKDTRLVYKNELYFYMLPRNSELKILKISSTIAQKQKIFKDSF